MSDSDTTCPSLLIRLRDPQQREAWSQFVNIYSPLIYRIATRNGLQDADASDVVQEVMRTVAEAIPQFEYDRARGTFRAWLKTVTHSRIADYRRRGKHQAAAHGDTGAQSLLEQVPDREDQDELWEREYQQTLFAWAAQQCRAEFQPSTWSAFWQTSVQGEAAKSVAAALGMSIGAVYIARSRVVGRLKKLIAQIEGEDVDR